MLATHRPSAVLRGRAKPGLAAKRATHLGVRIPVWITIAAAVLVGLFGLYRVYLGTRPPVEASQRRGLYSMSNKAHIFVGLIYLALCASLIGVSLGWNPFGSSIGPATEKPAKDKAPTKDGVPIDGLPKK